MGKKTAVINLCIRITCILAIFCIGTVATRSAEAASVTLRWDANNPEPEGYRIFIRRSDQYYDYSRPDWEGSSCFGTVHNLQDQTQYYFVVRAFAGHQESANSNEVHYVPSASQNQVSPPSNNGSDTTPPYWDGATSGIGVVSDTATGGRVTVEFDTARDGVDGRNLKFNVYYAPRVSWDSTDWTGNNVIAQANLRSGETFTHAVTIDGLTNGVRYTFGVRAEDQSGNEEANTSTLRATPSVGATQSPSHGYLDVSSNEPASAVDLSYEGLTDWAHWGLVNQSSVNRKSDGGQLIGNFKLLKSQVGRFSDARTTFRWSGGAPTRGVSGTTTGVFFPGAGNGYELSVAAGTIPQKLRLYLGGVRANGRLAVSLSDGSAAPYVAHFENRRGIYDRVVTLNFAAASDGAALRIQYRMESDFSNGNITLMAASLEDVRPF